MLQSGNQRRRQIDALDFRTVVQEGRVKAKLSNSGHATARVLITASGSSPLLPRMPACEATREKT